MNLSGFLRIVPTYPAPVLPVFVEEGSKKIFAQNIGLDQLVQKFEELDITDRKRIILTSRTPAAYNKLRLGDEAIYAYEIEEKNVAIRKAGERIDFLKEISKLPTLKKENPFFFLEVGRLINSPEILKEAAIACMGILARKSVRLAESWAKSSIEDQQILRDLMLLSQEITERTLIVERVNFTASQYLLGLIDFVSSQSGRTRASAIREAFTSEEFDIEAATSNAAKILDRVNRTYDEAKGAERSMISFARTKGSVFVDSIAYGLITSLRIRLRKELFDPYRRSRFSVVNSNTGSLNFLVLIAGIAATDPVGMDEALEMPIQHLVGNEYYNIMTRNYSSIHGTD